MFESERLMLIASPLMKRTPAFERAAALAQATGATLHIVAFDYLDGLASAGLIHDRMLDEMRDSYLPLHREWLEEQADLIRIEGLMVTTEVMWVTRPLTEILEHLREIRPSMVIKDLEHESWLKRVMFTPLDVRLLLDCPVPLHLVSKLDHTLPRKILAAVDPFRTEEHFEGINDSIIASAEKLAAQCDAQLHLLYAYDLTYVFESQGGMGFSTDLVQIVYEADELAFNELAARYAVPPECRHMVLGSPAKAIQAYALAEGIDVIVMGTVHRNRMTALLGSTTETVAYHMPCSLLTINPRQPAE